MLFRTDFFMYLQAGHFVQSNLTPREDDDLRDAFSETMSWNRYRSYKVRTLYPSLLEPLVMKSWKNALRGWSQDLPIVDSSDLWLKHCSQALRSLPSAAHLKTLQRAYSSLSQRKHMVPEETGRYKSAELLTPPFFTFSGTAVKLSVSGTNL